VKKVQDAARSAAKSQGGTEVSKPKSLPEPSKNLDEGHIREETGALGWDWKQFHEDDE